MEELQSIFEWLMSLPLPQYFLSLLAVIFSFVVMIVQVKKYKYYKQEKESILNYRTEDYQSKKGYSSPGQSFKKVVPTYELDEKSNSLVVVSTKDLQELVQSSRDCALDVVLEKYGVLPPVVPPAVSKKVDDVPFDATDLRDDFEFLSDTMDGFEELRSRYNMPDASVESLLKHVQLLKDNVDKSIQESLKSQVPIDKAGDVNG